MLEEEALKINESLNDSSLDSFTASNGWLGKWKSCYGIRETSITGEADDVSVSTVRSWIKDYLSWLNVTSWKTSGTWTN